MVLFMVLSNSRSPVVCCFCFSQFCKSLWKFLCHFVATWGQCQKHLVSTLVCCWLHCCLWGCTSFDYDFIIINFSLCFKHIGK